MDPNVVARLRRHQATRELPDGRQAVDVTVQYVGTVPATTRAQRRAFLEERFEEVARQEHGHLTVQPDSLSVSGQTVDALVPVDDLETMERRLAGADFRIDVMEPVQVVDEGPAT